MIRANDQIAVGLHHRRPAGRGFDAAGRGDAARPVNSRRERLARYRAARERVAAVGSLKAFQALVAEALDELPEYVRAHLENVAVVVEERAASERLHSLGHSPAEELLGLYEGINRVERASGYHLATPDRITLFWQPI